MVINALLLLFSVDKSCLTFCDPMDFSTPGSPVLHSLLEFAQVYVHWVRDANISSCATLFSLCLQSFPASGSFLMSRLFTSGGQTIGASGSASVLPMSIQGWFPLGLTILISLLSKGLSRVFSAPQFESINSSPLSLLDGPALTSIHDYWKNHGFDYMDQ